MTSSGGNSGTWYVCCDQLRVMRYAMRTAMPPVVTRVVHVSLFILGHIYRDKNKKLMHIVS